MQATQPQMHVITSVAVIMGAAVVALICDFLKRSNEQLRELAIELKVRREEESKRFQMLAPNAVTETAAPEQKQQAIAPAGKAAPQIAPPEGLDPKKDAKVEPPALRRKERPGRGERRPLSAEALAVIQRGEQLAAAPPSKRAAAERVHLRHSDSEPAEVPMPDRAGISPAIERAVELAPAVEAPVEIIEPTRVVPTVAGRNRDWSSLLSARRSMAAQVHHETRKPVVLEAANVAAVVPVEPALPAGFQDGYVLTRLVESRQPVTGLVVSIGTSATSHENGSLPANVVNLIQSLIGPGDFATQSGKDEFLLIYPAERGASAQRKLGQIAEQLWDFQLRSLGSLSIQFSWGGVEVRSESIAEAIASASERMQETRRNRKILTMEPRAESGAMLRRAV